MGDYVYIPPDWKMWSPWDALRIDRAVRDGIEARQSWEVAQQIADRLPKNEAGPPAAARGRANGWRAGMSWDVVVEQYFLPALMRAR